MAFFVEGICGDNRRGGFLQRDATKIVLLTSQQGKKGKGHRERKQEEGASGLPSESAHCAHSKHNRNCREGLSTAPAGKGEQSESIVVEDRTCGGTLSSTSAAATKFV